MQVPGFIELFGLFGVVVFAVSGALAARRRRLDPIGFILLGTVTAIGGGSIRDILLGNPAFWVLSPFQLELSIVACLVTYAWVGIHARRHRDDPFPSDSHVQLEVMRWLDAAGLSAFAVQGAVVALDEGRGSIVAVVMGMLTATGGGVIRDLLAGDRPMILRGQLYASTAWLGAMTLVVGLALGIEERIAAAAGFCAAFAARSAAMLFDLRMGPPGEFIRVRPPMES